MSNDVGSCWNEAPFGPGQSNGLLCELPSGHAGAHRAGDAEWMIRGPEAELSDAQVEAAAIAIHAVAEGGASWTDAGMTAKKQHRLEARAALRAACEVRR